jgi:cellulose synthase/poly-beta-1,6-N-acetylglucosamine synthase-like glycosyltransferase
LILTYHNSPVVTVDSDTQVPSDCLLDAVSEMETSPEVAILQFSSGVMQVSHNYFENGITFFTNLIYSAINYGVANGDVAPFVGHNAILRWSALQDVAVFEDDRIMFWSESHVSEDFDMALRLQIKGYITRLANWAHGGFKEGVSLTVCKDSNSDVRGFPTWLIAIIFRSTTNLLAGRNMRMAVTS